MDRDSVDHRHQRLVRRHRCYHRVCNLFSHCHHRQRQQFQPWMGDRAGSHAGKMLAVILIGQNFGGDGLWMLLFEPSWHDWTDIVHPCVAGGLWTRGRLHRRSGAGLHARFPHQALPTGRHLQWRYGVCGLPVLYLARWLMHATFAHPSPASHVSHPLLQPCCSCSSWSTMECFPAVPWEP